MEKQIVEIKVNDVLFRVEFSKTAYFYEYSFRRNKKTYKVSSWPKNRKSDIKMAIARDLMEYIYWEVIHNVEKIKIL